MTITIKRKFDPDRTYISDTVPQVGSEVSFDGDLYEVIRVVHHINFPAKELVDVYVRITHLKGTR
jgi:hypothetical protein